MMPTYEKGEAHIAVLAAIRLPVLYPADVLAIVLETLVVNNQRRENVHFPARPSEPVLYCLRRRRRRRIQKA